MKNKTGKNGENYSPIIHIVFRALEVMLCNAIPSALVYYVITKVPNIRLFHILMLISFLVMIICNALLCYRDIIAVKGSRKEYYAVNSCVYALFFVIALVLYKTRSVVLYTIIFATTRFLEFRGVRTRYSMAITFIIMFVSMILVGIFGYRIYTTYKQKMNDMLADEIEVDKDSDKFHVDNNRRYTGEENE